MVVLLPAKIQQYLNDGFRRMVSARPFIGIRFMSCRLRCILSGEYFHANFPNFISEQNLNISSLELLTVVVALKLWSPLLNGKKVVINCDNQISVRALNRAFCRDNFLQSCLREICFHAAINEFQIRAHEIFSCENRIPDYLSRSDLSPKFRSSFFQAVKGQHLVEYTVDESLITFSHDW